MKDRSSTDGKPFYCTICGSGWNEYMACSMRRRNRGIPREEMDCELESRAEAMKRYSDPDPIPESR